MWRLVSRYVPPGVNYDIGRRMESKDNERKIIINNARTYTNYYIYIGIMTL